MAGALAVGTLTVVATALPGQPGVQRAAAVLGSALVAFGVLVLGAKLLLARPAPVRVLWPGAVLGAAAVTVVLTLGAPLLARLVSCRWRPEPWPPAWHGGWRMWRRPLPTAPAHMR